MCLSGALFGDATEMIAKLRQWKMWNSVRSDFRSSSDASVVKLGNEGSSEKCMRKGSDAVVERVRTETLQPGTERKLSTSESETNWDNKP